MKYLISINLKKYQQIIEIFTFMPYKDYHILCNISRTYSL